MYSLVRLQQFRSYNDYTAELGEGVNIVVGPNASGKTNLLEAIYMLSTGKSFRGSSKEAIEDSKDWLRVDGYIEDAQRTIKLQPPKQLKLILDEKEVKKSLLWEKRLPVVLFDPEIMRLIRGSPQRRRDYLDGAMSQTDHIYSDALAKFNRALAQRNKLLKSARYNSDQMFVWDMKLAEYGAILIDKRAKFVTEINKQASKMYSTIAGGKHKLTAEYICQIDTDGDVQSKILKLLHQKAGLDRDRGHTSVGPHRDDLEFVLDSKDTQTHASRGESRSIVLALKIIEAERIEKATGKRPIMLLDDVFSELDASRRRYITEYLKEHQVIITTTDADAVIEHFNTGDYKIIPTDS